MPDAALIQFAVEMTRNVQVSDQTFAAVRSALGDDVTGGAGRGHRELQHGLARAGRLRRAAGIAPGIGIRHAPAASLRGAHHSAPRRSSFDGLSEHLERLRPLRRWKQAVEFGQLLDTE